MANKVIRHKTDVSQKIISQEELDTRELMGEKILGETRPFQKGATLYKRVKLRNPGFRDYTILVEVHRETMGDLRIMEAA